MPNPLTARSPGQLSLLEQALLVIFIGIPGAGLWYCFTRHQQVHFDDPSLNLAAHGGLVVFPVIWAFLFNCKPVVYESSDADIVLGPSRFFNRLPANWWMMFIMWATPLFAAVTLALALNTEYLPHAAELSTSPGRAVVIMVVFFCLGAFYTTLLLNRSDIPPRISNEGLRTGILRFYKWADIHHVSKHGDLYALYHRVNPALPAASLKIGTQESRAILERFLAIYNVPISNDSEPAYLMVKIAVLLGFAVNMLVDCWLRLNTSLSLVSILLISFGIGIVMTILLEKYRGISKFGKYKPILELDDTAAADSSQS